MAVAELPTPARRRRLRRSDPGGPGLARRRCGKGFMYLDEQGERITDAELVARITALVIPPAWREVWISPDPFGHIQATGLDEAGRKQYLYHPRWRERRDQEKFDDMIAFARALPALREVVDHDLALGDLSREQVLACAARLLDRGFFRIGSEVYAVTNETYGLATMRKEHVTVRGDTIAFDYVAKESKRRVQAIVDPEIADLIVTLKRRRGGNGELLAYKRDGPLVRRALAGHQRLPQGGDGPRRLGQGLPHLGRDGARVRRARRDGARTAQQDRPQARDHARREGGRLLPRQHAGRRAQLLHRPARLRPLRGRPGRSRPRSARSATIPTTPRSRDRSRRRCSSC